LLQWDGRERKYNLHPVVRGVASGGMSAADREDHGRRVVDYFSLQPHRPYEETETMEDVGSGLHVVRTLLKLDRKHAALDAFGNGLSYALSRNLGLEAVSLSILRQFFLQDWRTLADSLTIAEQ